LPLTPLMNPKIDDVVQKQVGQERRDHPSHNLAKLPFDLSVRLRREQLRTRYGAGFSGAPVLICPRSGESPSECGGADDQAQRGGCGPESAGQP
jgi:hypothetical protein